MGPAAQVNKTTSIMAVGGVGVFVDLFDEAELELLTLLLEQLFSFSAAEIMLHEVAAAADDLSHPLFDSWQIGLVNGWLGADVVVEAVLQRRAGAKTGAGEQVAHCLSHDMGAGVAHSMQ